MGQPAGGMFPRRYIVQGRAVELLPWDAKNISWIH